MLSNQTLEGYALKTAQLLPITQYTPITVELQQYVFIFVLFLNGVSVRLFFCGVFCCLFISWGDSLFPFLQQNVTSLTSSHLATVHKWPGGHFLFLSGHTGTPLRTSACSSALWWLWSQDTAKTGSGYGRCYWPSWSHDVCAQSQPSQRKQGRVSLWQFSPLISVRAQCVGGGNLWQLCV